NAAPPVRIFPLIADFRRWPAWSPWEKKDPAMKRSFAGPDRGVGAAYAWDGDKNVGTGRMEIIEAAAPSRVALKLDFEKPFEAHNTVAFVLTPAAGGTTVTWTMDGPVPFLFRIVHLFMDMDRMVGGDFEAGLAALKAEAEKPEARSAASNGGRLAVTAEGEREIVMTRTIAAPRAFVYRAWTSPELLRQWFGPPGWSLPTADVDARVGGGFRFVMRSADGTEMGIRGSYKEVVAGERIVHEETFDQDWTGGPTTVTTVWAEDTGRTTQTTTVRYSSAAARDAVLQSGMAGGLEASFARLDALAAAQGR
ncbi:MAG: SRPBCC domain-containing protein, partial [Alphaproteobacteria bacterium]